MRLAAVTAGAPVLTWKPPGRRRCCGGSPRAGHGAQRHPRGKGWPSSDLDREHPGPGGLLARLTQTRRAPLSAPRAHAPSPRGPAAAHTATFADGTHRSETPLAQGLEGSVDPRPPRTAACTSHAPARPRPISGRQPRRRLARVPRRPRKELASRACARAALHTHLGVILDAVTLPGGRDVSDWGGGEERASRVPPGTRQRRAGARPGRGARGKARSRPSDRPESQEDAAPWAPPASAHRSAGSGAQGPAFVTSLPRDSPRGN